MAYIRYKEVTKHFNFSKVVNPKNLLSYINDYAYNFETILAECKMVCDYGMVANKK